MVKLNNITVSKETEAQAQARVKTNASIRNKKLLKWGAIACGVVGFIALATRYGKIPEGLSMDPKDYE